MRKLLLTIGLALLITELIFGQWSGTSLDGNTYRNGNVGIGNSNPTEKLDIHGNIKLGNNDGSGNNTIYFYRYNDKPPAYISGFPGKYSPRQGLKLSGSYEPNAMVINWNGNIGIGHDKPKEKLDMHGNIKLGNNDGSGNNTIYFYRYNDKPPAYISGFPGKYSPRQGLKLSASYETNALVINWNGNIGMGIDDPEGYKLNVCGTVRANEVKVNLTGCDFVFEDDYPLRSLKEVENFIKENKRLPEIEAATEMEADGTNLGELNSKLLQKIEELTLYTIAQEKRIDELEKQNERIKELEKQNKEILELLKASR